MKRWAVGIAALAILATTDACTVNAGYWPPKPMEVAGDKYTITVDKPLDQARAEMARNILSAFPQVEVTHENSGEMFFIIKTTKPEPYVACGRFMLTCKWAHDGSYISFLDSNGDIVLLLKMAVHLTALGANRTRLQIDGLYSLIATLKLDPALVSPPQSWYFQTGGSVGFVPERVSAQWAHLFPRVCRPTYSVEDKVLDAARKL